MRINPKQMEKMAKKMGLKTEEIDALEVVIKTSDKDIIISNPSVAKLNMMGQESFQITGEISERSSGPTDEDIKTVAEQAGVSEDEAKTALEETDGDLAEAILKLKG